jgi:hypothetical protein
LRAAALGLADMSPVHLRARARAGLSALPARGRAGSA